MTNQHELPHALIIQLDHTIKYIYIHYIALYKVLMHECIYSYARYNDTVEI